ncbi:hypothetical protein R1sor_009632 [Riccia sorocarpa]|uniref:Uncharacterized protein n=1 Tax=Riccia sorocarpa TaxID=122646 RepID=A0ABD3HXH4_9MARC
MTTSTGTLPLSSWNVGGLRAPHRRYAVRSFLTKTRPVICALQETHIDAEKVEFFIATMLGGKYKTVAVSAIDAREIATRREGPKFTRAQVRDGNFTWSRIDRGYVTQEQVAKVIHHSQYCSSEHIPLSILITLDGEQPDEGTIVKSVYFKADHVLVEEELEDLTEKWRELEVQHEDKPPIEKFVFCWAGIRTDIKKRQYKKAQRLHSLPEKEDRLRQLIRLDPTGLNREQQKEIEELINEVKELEAWKLHRWRLTSRENFLRDGEANTAYFFQKFKKRRARINLGRIKKEDGEVIESPEEIKREVLRSFTQLYSRQNQDEGDRRCTEELLQNVHLALTPEQRLMVEDAPTDLELHEALLLLPQDKSPGVDGMGKEVMVALWPIMDDTAVYMEVNERSARNLFDLLNVVQRASGGKTNVGKSKVLMIGKRIDYPTWLRDFGLQMVEDDEQTRYLGAALTTKWRGVDNGRALLAAVTRKAQTLSSPFLSFEARAIALKHVVFSSTIYHLMSSTFKKGALSKVDSVLRGYIWAKDKEDNQKKALVSWRRLALPESWGGLGVFELQRFQAALLCKTMLRAMENSAQSLWAPVFLAAFLKVDGSDLFTAMTTKDPPVSLKGCPVASLMLQSWASFFSEFKWRPQQPVPVQEVITKQGFFLLARRSAGIPEALKVADVLFSTSQYLNVSSVPIFCQLYRDGRLPTAITEDVVAREVMDSLLSARLTTALQLPSLQDWRDQLGGEFSLKMRGTHIYRNLLGDKELEQVEEMNKRWRLRWDRMAWREVWRTYGLKGIPK